MEENLIGTRWVDLDRRMGRRELVVETVVEGAMRGGEGQYAVCVVHRGGRATGGRTLIRADRLRTAKVYKRVEGK